MTHEEIFKKPNGDKVKVQCRLRVEYFTKVFSYDIDVWVCKKGKRTYLQVEYSDNIQFRRSSFEERQHLKHKAFSEHVTEEQLLEVKLKTWNLLKPI